MPFAATWMDLKIIILSEISQLGKDISSDITYMWYLKKDTNKFTYKPKQTYRHRKQSYCYQSGGRTGINQEVGIKIQILLYVNLDFPGGASGKEPACQYTRLKKHIILIFLCLEDSLECVYVCVCARALSCVQLLATPWTVALQVPLSMEFSRQNTTPWKKWQPIQCSCLENPMDRGTWQTAVHGAIKSGTQQLSTCYVY